MHEITIIYITNPSIEKAQELANHLLGKKLIACANVVPVKSMYWWQGAIAHDDEVVLVAKTVPEAVGKVEQAVSAVHPYQIPCIVQISAKANAKYAQWVRESVVV